ncbi:hypothetical protein M0R45_029097 [Rubus argutus]|uniref:Uncharacterized protein n=1 Tax=Rubus argutus TaxID=59490 RepID=A0AAW1W774_RUBAR
MTASINMYDSPDRTACKTSPQQPRRHVFRARFYKPAVGEPLHEHGPEQTTKVSDTTVHDWVIPAGPTREQNLCAVSPVEGHVHHHPMVGSAAKRRRWWLSMHAVHAFESAPIDGTELRSFVVRYTRVLCGWGCIS